MWFARLPFEIPPFAILPGAPPVNDPAMRSTIPVSRRTFVVASGLGFAGLTFARPAPARRAAAATSANGREIDDFIFLVRRGFAHRLLGHEARSAAGISRALPTDRDDGPGDSPVRASAAIGEAGPSFGARQLDRWHGQHERPSRRLLLQPDRAYSRSDFSELGEQPHSVCRRLALHGKRRRGQASRASRHAQRDHAAA